MANKSQVFNNPFLARVNCSKHEDFDKYYYDVTEKEVFVESGIDSDGEKIGISEKRFIIKKVDIAEFLESQRDSVGIESYMNALAVQGADIGDYNTIVSDDVQDFSEMPDTLADVMLAGDNARAAFDKLDPALKGDHTTVEGFLNSLSLEKIDSYIKGKVEAAFPVSEAKGE